jgi:signal transduction histidine kinase
MSRKRTAPAAPAAATTELELEQAMQALSSVSNHLLASSAELARRAERVEGELAQANAVLAAKVEELDRVKSRLEAILRALPTGVLVRDRHGRPALANDALQTILGQSEAELLRGQGPAALRADPRGGEELAYARADGTQRLLSRRRSDVRGTQGEPYGSVEIVEDRSEIARLGERLHQMDKLAALGTLAAGIAHEIRNPLSAVGGFAALLMRELEAGSQAARFAERIRAGADEANGIITNLLSFSAPQRLARERIEPGELVEAALAGLPAAESGARRELRVRVEAPAFRGDRIKLRQAIRNLVGNALEAQPADARVELELVREHDQLVLRVCDDGPGIPEALRSKVLEPFFTTRAAGTGLGLPLVHTIAQLHGGNLEIGAAGAPLRGARIELRFPFHAADELARESAAPTLPVPSQS